MDIEYSPVVDGRPDPGEVVWAWVPYEDDPSRGKDRPVLVLNRHGNRLTALALTRMLSAMLDTCNCTSQRTTVF